MREFFCTASLAILLLPAPRVAQAMDEPAQPLESFRDLALRVQIGNQVRIEDNSGVRISVYFGRGNTTLPTRSM